jgi:hypothetical protein
MTLTPGLAAWLLDVQAAYERWAALNGYLRRRP